MQLWFALSQLDLGMGIMLKYCYHLLDPWLFTVVSHVCLNMICVWSSCAWAISNKVGPQYPTEKENWRGYFNFSWFSLNQYEKFQDH